MMRPFLVLGCCIVVRGDAGQIEKEMEMGS